MSLGLSITWESFGMFVLVVGVCWGQYAVCLKETTASCNSLHPHQGRNGWGARSRQLP